MHNDNLLEEVYRQLRTAQDKYTYFLSAATGAAIALVINQTQGSTLTWSQAPLAVAVLCWGLSFFFGCRHLEYVSSNLYANAEFLKVQSGEHPEVRPYVRIAWPRDNSGSWLRARSSILPGMSWRCGFLRSRKLTEQGHLVMG